MQNRSELEEIAHSGGKITFDIQADAEGKLSYAIEWSHCRPNAAALFAVYAIDQGIPVADLKLEGMGVPWDPPPLPGCFPVFISSDSTGMFGHECPICGGYWRASHGGKTCPYCGSEFKHSFHLLTKTQKCYVQEYCSALNAVLGLEQPGKYEINMDDVADAAGNDQEKPPFYYAEERQQHLFKCLACGRENDVLGTYAYCGSCGTRNDLQIFTQTIDSIRQRINSGGPFESCSKDCVAAFDSFCGQYAKQLLNRVPLSPNRKSRLKRMRFHNLETTDETFLKMFDVTIFKGISQDDIDFAKLMFHRRHVYEHNGGEADEKYISESGDQVRLKQALRETQESAHRIASQVIRMATNLHEGFHEIFPPDKEPIERHQRMQQR